MPGKHNKCCCNCQIGFDNFNRADDTTLGPKWTEDGSGLWGIYGNVAYSDPGDAVAMFNTAHRKGDESMEVHYEIVDEVDEAIYYVLVNVKDLNNYHIAKFHNTAVNPKIELGKVVGGVYTMLKEENIIGKTGAYACPDMPRLCRRFYARIAPDEFCAGIREATLSQVTTTPEIIAGGIYSGMGGFRDDTRLEYDNFYFGEHLETNRRCPTCICQCEDTVVGEKLLVTISDTTGRMTTAEGCEIEINYDRVNGYWQGTASCCSFSWVIRLFCPSSFAPEDFIIEVVQGCKDSDEDTTVPGYIDNGKRYALDSSTCDPFYLRFGPIQVTEFDFACGCIAGGAPPFAVPGVYYLEVTKTL